MTGNRYDVLVAEDEAIIALEIRQLLSRNNFNVVGVVRSGEDLIKESEKTNPDIILSDIHLNGELDRIEAANIIHKYQNTPAIFLTGYGDDFTHSRACSVSSSTFLLKPFNERILIKSVKDIIGNISRQ